MPNFFSRLIRRTPPNVESLLVDLLKIESLSGHELPICDYTFQVLQNLGFRPEKIPVDENGYNIVVKIGEPRIYFSSHLDVVPPFLPVKITHSAIFGRGASDAGGSVAAMIFAAKEAIAEGYSNFGLIFTVGEETNFRGVNKIIESGLKIPFVVVGEPTGLKVVNEHFGVLLARLTAKGKDVYGDVEEGRVNAIDKIVDAINLLDKLFDKLQKELNTLFNIGKISGGRGPYLVSDYAEALIDTTVPPGYKGEEIYRQIKKVVKKYVKVELIEKTDGVKSDIPKELSFLKKGPVINLLTELSIYRNGVVLGPGNIKNSHTTKERITKRELHQAVKIYKQIIAKYQ